MGKHQDASMENSRKSGSFVMGEMPVVGFSRIVTKEKAIVIMTGNAWMDLYADTTTANIFMESIAKVLIVPMIAAKSLGKGDSDKSSDCAKGLVCGSPWMVYDDCCE